MPEVTILQVVPRLDAGGSEQAAVEIAQALTRAGATALVATEGGRMATALAQAGGEIIPLPMADLSVRSLRRQVSFRPSERIAQFRKE